MKSITTFWEYFIQNNFALHLIHELESEIQKQKLNELDNQLKTYDKNLGFLIKTGTTKSKLTITAHGNPYLFKTVELLIHYAPKLKYWNFESLINPEENLENYKNGTDKPFEFHGIILRVSEIKFTIISNQQNPFQLGLRIYLKNHIVHKNNQNLQMAVYILLEHLVGEKTFANEINCIDITQHTGIENNTMSLFKLNEFITNFKKRFN